MFLWGFMFVLGTMCSVLLQLLLSRDLIWPSVLDFRIVMGFIIILNVPVHS